MMERDGELLKLNSLKDRDKKGREKEAERTWKQTVHALRKTDFTPSY